MRCPKCHSLTRVDLQSLLDNEGLRYRRACVACSWDAWEGELVGRDHANRLLALERLLDDPGYEPQPAPALSSAPDGGRQRETERPLRGGRPQNRRPSRPEPTARPPLATIAS
jgi:hypothetical protein